MNRWQKHPDSMVQSIVALHGVKPAKDIAAKFGITRNAVIGIWYRERQKSGVKPPQPVPGMRKPAKAAPKPAEPNAVAPLPVLAPLARVKGRHAWSVGAAAAVETTGCRWPCGDPKDPGFFFCCEPVEALGRPYCTVHRKIAWEPRPRRIYSGWKTYAPSNGAWT